MVCLILHIKTYLIFKPAVLNCNRLFWVICTLSMSKTFFLIYCFVFNWRSRSLISNTTISIRSPIWTLYTLRIVTILKLFLCLFSFNGEKDNYIFDRLTDFYNCYMTKSNKFVSTCIFAQDTLNSTC